MIIGRLVPGIRSLISVPAGIGQMNLGLFMLYTAIGASMWSSLLAYLGFLMGENYDKVEKYLSPASYVVLGVILLVYVYRVIKQHRQEKSAT